MAKTPSMKQVAEAAGVSTATVSYVINRQAKQHILPETQEKVYAAIRELGYIPLARRKAFKNIGSRYIGVVMHRDLAEPDVAEMLSGLCGRLSRLGYYPVLFNDQTREIGVQDYIGAYLDGTIAGIVFVTAEEGGPDDKSRTFLNEREVPFVVEDKELLTKDLGETRAEDIVWLIEEM